MQSASAEIHIAIPPDRVWEKMRDLSKPHLYVPGLTGCQMITAQREGVDASRRVFQKGRAPMDETVIEWREAQGFVVRLHNGDKPPIPFKEAYFSYQIEPATDGGTIFKPSMTYTLRGGIFGLLLDRLFLNRFVSGVVRKIALNLKQYYESGQPSNPAFQNSQPAPAGKL